LLRGGHVETLEVVTDADIGEHSGGVFVKVHKRAAGLVERAARLLPKGRLAS
jgi:hypothetical protein